MDESFGGELIRELPNTGGHSLLLWVGIAVFLIGAVMVAAALAPKDKV